MNHLERVTLAAVGTYEREEDGKLERVSGYERKQLARHIVTAHGIDPFSLPEGMDDLRRLDAQYHYKDDPREILRGLGRSISEFYKRGNSNRIHDEVMAGKAARRREEQDALPKLV